MAGQSDVNEVAEALRLSVGLLSRRARQVHHDGELSWPERSALSRLDRDGPTTSGALAKLEQITPQSMGTTLGALEDRGLVQRRADPVDRRRVVLSLTAAGVETVQHRRSGRTELLAAALSEGFSADELALLEAAAPLIERLAHRL
jgi:DNA-binding MarR family transcriptional regulator